MEVEASLSPAQSKTLQPTVLLWDRVATSHMPDLREILQAMLETFSTQLSAVTSQVGA